MTQPLNRFPRNEIVSLIGASPQFDLAESVGPDLTLGTLLGGIDAHELSNFPLSYGTVAGDESLRTYIAVNHGVTANDVVTTVGGMQTLFLTAFILCKPGDEVVTTTSLFPNARSVLQAVGAVLRELPISFTDNYRLDPNAFKKLLSPNTKLVSLASPQNPSGVALSLIEVNSLLSIMKKICPDAYLLVDETYREAAYGDRLTAPSAANLSDKVLVCASLSKCHGAPALRLGWAITRDPRLRDQILLGKFNTVVSCSPLDEMLALKVLEQQQSIIDERRCHLAQGYAAVENWILTYADFVEWVAPNAGALCCVRLKTNAFDTAAVYEFYQQLTKLNIRVANGQWFGDEERVFRLGFGLLPIDDLKVALKKISTLFC